ncbi:MAG: hypothetical protein LBS51_02320 [Oscillospiraceae bacterium]|jgi:hypothetical protein|nr:hypothetical protein [Oscillospiraceae bacterium]
MSKIIRNKRVLALALAVVMAAALIAMPAGASGPLDPDYTQETYLWWFGDPVYTPGHYPEFQQAPMGDTAIIGYDVLDVDTTRFYFRVAFISGYDGYIDSIMIDGEDYYVAYGPDPYDGGYADLPTPYDSVNPGYMLQIDTLGIALIDAPMPHIDLHNIWLEVDFSA